MVTPGDIVAEAGRRLLREGYSIHHAQDAVINRDKMVSWASAFTKKDLWFWSKGTFAARSVDDESVESVMRWVVQGTR